VYYLDIGNALMKSRAINSGVKQKNLELTGS
jgi:hypothetical protein